MSDFSKEMMGSWEVKKPKTEYTVTGVEGFKPPTECCKLRVFGDDVSDGHHTMSELYEHRHRLFLALVKIYDNYITPLNCNVRCWKSKNHNDGSVYEGWFLLGMSIIRQHFLADVPDEKWEISYHLPMKYWDVAKVVALERAPKWDGYTSQDVLERLLRL